MKPGRRFSRAVSMPIIHIASVLDAASAADHGADADEALAGRDVFADRDVTVNDHENQNVPHPRMVPGMRIPTLAEQRDYPQLTRSHRLLPMPAPLRLGACSRSRHGHRRRISMKCMDRQGRHAIPRPITPG